MFDDDDYYGDTGYSKSYSKSYYKEPSVIQYYQRRIIELEAENARLQQELNESVNLACEMASTSDSMKLQLILCGALTMPSKTCP